STRRRGAPTPERRPGARSPTRRNDDGGGLESAPVVVCQYWYTSSDMLETTYHFWYFTRAVTARLRSAASAPGASLRPGAPPGRRRPADAPPHVRRGENRGSAGRPRDRCRSCRA